MLKKLISFLVITAFLGGCGPSKPGSSPTSSISGSPTQPAQTIQQVEFPGTWEFSRYENNVPVANRIITSGVINLTPDNDPLKSQYMGLVWSDLTTTIERKFKMCTYRLSQMSYGGTTNSQGVNVIENGDGQIVIPLSIVGDSFPLLSGSFSFDLKQAILTINGATFKKISNINPPSPSTSLTGTTWQLVRVEKSGLQNLTTADIGEGLLSFNKNGLYKVEQYSTNLGIKMICNNPMQTYSNSNNIVNLQNSCSAFASIFYNFFGYSNYLYLPSGNYQFDIKDTSLTLYFMQPGSSVPFMKYVYELFERVY